MRSKIGRFLRDIKKDRMAYFFLLPALSYYIVFNLYPMINGLMVAFFDWDGLSPLTAKDFVGFQNIIRVLFHDERIWPAVGRNVIVAVSLVIGRISLGLILALALEAIWDRLQTPIKTILFVPHLLSMVIVALIFYMLFDPNFGMVNTFLQGIGLGVLARSWLTETQPILGWGNLALFTIVAVMIWSGYGMVMVLYHAAYRALPGALFEAARIDGANEWQILRYVTWPLLWPITTLLVILTVIGSFQAFDVIYVMTAGGPMNMTETLAVYIYKQAFGGTSEMRNYGYSVSISLVLFAIIAGVTLLNLKVLQRRSALGNRLSERARG